MFYGESYGLTGVTNVSGSSATYDALYYHFDGLTVEASAGDSFLANVFPTPGDSEALSEATDAVVSWVVEVAPGSAGTLKLSSGLDPTGSGTTPGYATQELGSHSVVGEGPVVVAASITSADILNRFEVRPVLLVECTSGSVSIQQVKLRVWPAAGPGGSWVDAPSWTSTRDVRTWNSEPDNWESPTAGSVEEAWALGRAHLDSLDGQPFGYLEQTSASMSQRLDLASASLDPYSHTELKVSIVSAWLDVESGTGPGVVGGVDPREVEDEPWGATVRAVGGGPLVPVFDTWAPGSVVTIDGAGQIGVEAISEPVFTPHPTLAGWDLRELTVPTPDGAPRTAGESAPLPDSPHLAVAVFAPNYFGVVEDVSGVTGGVTAPWAVVTIPAYQFYDPTAVATQPRFFVKHRDDSMRPVGFGKPATELTVFRVPGGGRWRDLTADEYATYGPDVRPPGGVALKVKRLDAGGSVWWDQVGWMVPD